MLVLLLALLAQSANVLEDGNKALDGGKTCLPQRLFLGAELLEDLADLPVGRMNDSHDDSLPFDVATALAA